MNKEILKITLFCGLITVNFFNPQALAMDQETKPELVIENYSNKEIGLFDQTDIKKYFQEITLKIEGGTSSNINLDLSKNHLEMQLEKIDEKLTCDFLVSLLKPIVINKKLTHLDLSYNDLFNTDICAQLQKLNPNLKIRMCIF